MKSKFLFSILFFLLSACGAPKTPQFYQVKSKQNPLSRPADGPINSPYGWRFGKLHKGIDFLPGQTDQIKAAAPGLVEIATKTPDYGYLLVIEHPTLKLKTLYAHNSKLFVQEGDLVNRGQVIALMGATGKATGIHLHFEVWDLLHPGTPQDPELYLRN